MKPIYLMLSSLLIITSTCDMLKNEDPKLRVKNVSEKAIYVSWTTDYPDTSFNRVANPTYNPELYKVEAHSVQKEYYKAPSKGLFRDVDTISVFIFDAQVLESTPWDTVKAKYLILKRYDLSLDDLINMNWILTYP
jgi:hypothetical protein